MVRIGLQLANEERIKISRAAAAHRRHLEPEPAREPASADDQTRALLGKVIFALSIVLNEKIRINVCYDGVTT